MENLEYEEIFDKLDNDNDSEQMEEEEEALQNPLVVHKIMENLQIAHLLRCRLVNVMWNQLATQLVLKRDCCIVKIIYDSNSKTFRRYSKKKKPHRRWTSQNDTAAATSSVCQEGRSHQQQVNLQQKEQKNPELKVLNEILENSAQFPCSDFNFLGGGDLAHESVSKFFKIYGPNIKTLGLAEGRNIVSLTSKSTFKNIIFHLTPNVQNLAIRGFNYCDDDDDENENNEDEGSLSLLSLQKFSWRGGGDRTIMEIMRNCPNLNFIQDFDLKCDLDLVTKAGQCQAIRKLYCDRQTEPKKLMQFLQIAESQSSSSSRIQSLTFFIDDSLLKDPIERRMELTEAFLKLMDFAKNSLEFLDLSELCSHTEIQRLPVFSRLKTLVGLGGKCFPSRINLSEIFPNLHTLDCTGRQRHFPPPGSLQGILPRVDTLVISARCTENWMLSLGQLYPKNLVLVTRDSLDEILPLVFKLWRHLQRIDLKVEEYEEEFFYMDSLLCGFDEETCERLKAAAAAAGHRQGSLTQEPVRVEGFEKLRVAPSLCDLKNLRSLRIIFDSYSHFKLAKPTRNYLPISFLSGLYAFRLMPDLSVTIEFDQNCSWIEEIKSKFESIAPYVNFAHRHHDFDD